MDKLTKSLFILGLVTLISACWPIQSERFLGRWQSNCVPIDRVMSPVDLPISVLWMQEDLNINEASIASDIKVYFNSSCTLAADLLDIVPLSRGGTLTAISDFTTEDGYAAVSYSLTNELAITSKVELASIDNVLYSVFFDPLDAILTDDPLKKFVIFDWYYTKQ